ncbi:hypothetical protein UY3_16208 [Chelonia mydas]|uniref:Nose resistant-to-fluoxetine protein N-terminal domain-containing protein n=1 Tax=Chelonia mydas TaxID=8469 RepID=M7AQ25_CHEMY|nr:hypothetical protein UY3_16208 [Chelonia mydas]
MLLLMPLIHYASPVRNVSLRCLEDTNQFLSDLNAVEPKAYAIMMYDSLGKLGSNILGGNTDRLGSYTECLSAKVPSVSSVSVARCAKGLFSIDAFAAICLFVSILFIVLPITGTVYAAAVRWEVKFDESPSDSLPSANYGSTSSNEKDKRESKGDIRRNHYKMNSVLPVVSDDVCYTKKNNVLEWKARVLKNPIYVYSRSGPFYLGVDTFFLIRSKCGLIILGTTLFLASFTVTALLSSFFRLPVASPSDTREMSTVMYFTEYYTKPYCRYGPFLVGVLLELFMYHQQAQILTNKVQASLGWLCAMLAMLAVVSLAYTIEDSVNSYSPAAVIYQALHRTLWAAAIGWIIFACQEGYGGSVPAEHPAQARYGESDVTNSRELYKALVNIVAHAHCIQVQFLNSHPQTAALERNQSSVGSQSSSFNCFGYVCV